MKNPEDRKLLGWDMRMIIWAREKRSCKRCNKTLYQTRKPRGMVHHIDFNKKNNKVTNLVLLCSGCHQEVHHFHNENKYKYIWEMELITGIECDRSNKHEREYGRDEYPSYCYHYTTKCIDELERENAILVLPKEDVERLEYLKTLKERLIIEYKKQKKEI